MLGEDIREGQRVEAFAVDIWNGTDWKQIASGTTIGYKRLLQIPDVTTQKVRVRVIRARITPSIVNLGLFLESK
jgi:alpha-L-fucosidase